VRPGLKNISFKKTSFSPQAKEAGADDILDISKCELSEVNRMTQAVNLICPVFLGPWGKNR
jgi:hypothetical protein